MKIDLMNPKFYKNYVYFKLSLWLTSTLITVAWINLSFDISNARCPSDWENTIPYIQLFNDELCARSDIILPIAVYFILGIIFVIGFTLFELINLRNNINRNKLDRYAIFLLILFLYTAYNWFFEGGFVDNPDYGIIHKGQFLVPLVYVAVIPFSGLLFFTYISEPDLKNAG